MEESLLHEIFGVSKSYRSTGTEVKQGGVFVAVEPLDKLYICPECRSRDVIRKGRRIRRVQTWPIGFHLVYLEVGVPRCQWQSYDTTVSSSPRLGVEGRGSGREGDRATLGRL